MTTLAPGAVLTEEQFLDRIEALCRTGTAHAAVPGVRAGSGRLISFTPQELERALWHYLEPGSVAHTREKARAA